MNYLVWNPDPVLIDFGLIKIRWYGLLFATAFLLGFNIMKSIYIKEERDEENLDSLFVYLVVGTIVGARLGHCFFYNPSYYLSNPFKLIAVWEGGLASHGGGIGILTALYFYQKKFNESYLELLDRLTIPTALGGMFIRIANFFNSEIIGVPTLSTWGVIFKRVDMIPRHPAQLYEAFSYGLIFIFLFFLYKKIGERLGNGTLFGLFLLLIFGARFMVEFVKTKQAFYSSGFILSTGQTLSIPFILIGLFFTIKGSIGNKKKDY